MSEYNDIVSNIRNQIKAALAALDNAANADLLRIKTKLDLDRAAVQQHGKVLMDEAMAKWREAHPKPQKRGRKPKAAIDKDPAMRGTYWTRRWHQGTAPPDLDWEHLPPVPKNDPDYTDAGDPLGYNHSATDPAHLEPLEEDPDFYDDGLAYDENGKLIED